VVIFKWKRDSFQEHQVYGDLEMILQLLTMISNKNCLWQKCVCAVYVCM